MLIKYNKLDNDTLDDDKRIRNYNRYWININLKVQ